MYPETLVQKRHGPLLELVGAADGRAGGRADEIADRGFFHLLLRDERNQCVDRAGVVRQVLVVQVAGALRVASQARAAVAVKGAPHEESESDGQGPEERV